MRGAIPPLHNTCSRRNAELRTGRNLSWCSDWLENCAESRSVDRMSKLFLYLWNSRAMHFKTAFEECLYFDVVLTVHRR